MFYKRIAVVFAIFLFQVFYSHAYKDSVDGSSKNITSETQNSVPITATIISTLTTSGICNGSSDGKIYFLVNANGFALTATNGWSVSSDTVFLDSLTSGYYSTFVQNILGDTLTLEYIITDYPLPVGQIDYANSNLGDCGGGTGSVEIQISNGTPPYSAFPAGVFSVFGNIIRSAFLVGDFYSVQIVDSNGCRDDVYFAVEFDDFNLGSPYGNFTVSCNGIDDGTVTIPYYPTNFGIDSISGSLAWSITPDEIFASNLAPGSYSVYVYDVYGCLSTANFTINPSNFRMTLNSSNTNCIGCNDGSIKVDASGYFVAYTINVTPPATIIGDSILNLSPGIYTVCLTDSSGCTLCETDTIFDDVTTVSTINDNQIIIFPNPVSGAFRIISSDPNSIQLISLLNIEGRKMDLEIHKVDSGFELITKDLANGIYFLNLKTDGFLNKPQKLIISN